MQEQRYAEACPKFDESRHLDLAVGTLLNLAVCYERGGKLAPTAWSTFFDMAAKAEAAGQKDRARVAQARAAALAPRVSKIVIAVARDATHGIEVTRDGERVGQAQFGVEIPIDPGAHVVAASAAGKKPWSTSARATEGRTSNVSVPELEPVAGSAEAEPSGAVRPLPLRPSLRTSRAPWSTAGLARRQKVLALVCAGVGVIGLGIGAGFGIDSMSKHSDANSQCPDATCANSSGTARWHDAVTSGDVSTVAFVAGGVVLAGAAVPWVTAKSQPSAPSSVQMGLSWGSVHLRGTW